MLKGENGRFAGEHREAAHDGTMQNAKTFAMLDFSAPRARLPAGREGMKKVTALEESIFAQ